MLGIRSLHFTCPSVQPRPSRHAFAVLPREEASGGLSMRLPQARARPMYLGFLLLLLGWATFLLFAQ